MKYFIILFAPLVLFACSTYSEDELDDFDAQIKTYIKKQGIEVKKSPSGLYYRIDEAGDEPKIKFSDVVSFKYTGKLLNGEVFDNNNGQPLTSSVRELIAAWKEILLELGKGGKAYFIAPPQLGYGTNELEKIPKNSILIYELEVINVE